MHHNTTTDFDIIIIGGGVVGLTCALSIIKNNPQLKVAIFEILDYQDKFKHEILDDRIYAIAPSNIQAFLTLGLTDLNNYNKVVDVESMQIHANNNKLEFNQQLAQSIYLAKIIEETYLLKLIHTQLLKFNNVQIIKESLESIAHTTEITSKFVTIHTKHKTYTTKLLIAANGANSCVRSYINTQVNDTTNNTQIIDYQQNGVVANFKVTIPHNNCARQWFLQDKILAFLPLPNNCISIVLSCSDAKEIVALSDNKFTNLISSLSDNYLGEMQLISKARFFPLKMSLINKLYYNNTVLIGDAAHTIHPLAGMGLNLGIADALILSKLITQSVVKVGGLQVQNINSLLVKYNVLRLTELRKVQLTCHVLQRSFMSQNKFMRFVCDFGVKITNSNFLLKKFLSNQACNFINDF